MKTLEDHPNLPNWWNAWQNRLAVDTDRITSRAWAWGEWGVYVALPEDPYWRSGIDGKRVLIKNPWTWTDEPAQHMQSMIWNAERFERIVYVDGNVGGRAWSWRPKGKDYRHTIILGWKINGRLALTARCFHSDAASARGTWGPNSGQAVGSTFGPA